MKAGETRKQRVIKDPSVVEPIRTALEKLGYPSVVTRDEIASIILFGEYRKIRRVDPGATKVRWNISVVLPDLGYQRVTKNTAAPRFEKVEVTA